MTDTVTSDYGAINQAYKVYKWGEKHINYLKPYTIVHSIYNDKKLQ